MEMVANLGHHEERFYTPPWNEFYDSYDREYHKSNESLKEAISKVDIVIRMPKRLK